MNVLSLVIAGGLLLHSGSLWVCCCRRSDILRVFSQFYFPSVCRIGLTAAVPVLWLFYKAGTLRISVDRRRALLTADEQLGASNGSRPPMSLREPEPSAFMMAAVDDASSWVERGRDARFNLKTQRSRLRSAFLAVPSAILLGMVFPAGNSPAIPGCAGRVKFQLDSLIDVDGPGKLEDEVAGEDRGDEVEGKRGSVEEAPKQKAVNRQEMPTPKFLTPLRIQTGNSAVKPVVNRHRTHRVLGTPSTSGQPSKSEQQSPRKKKKKKSKPSPERGKDASRRNPRGQCWTRFVKRL